MLRSGLLAGLALVTFSQVGLAQDYPTKPVRLIVPYDAGGAVDYVGRVLAQHLSESLGQQVVVENRSGASGSIGAQAVLSAPADGYTLLMTSVTSNAITTAMSPDAADYDLLEDFVPAGIVGRVPLLLVAARNVPATTVDELVSHAGQQDQPLAYASSGVGSTEHLGAVLFGQLTELDLLHIPYTGGAPAMADVVAGRVPLMVATVPTALPHIDAESVTPLVIALDQRVEALPDVPSADEAGLESFDVASVYGVLAPAGVDASIVETLQEAIADVAADEDFSSQLAERGIVSSSNLTVSYDEFYRQDVNKWRDLVGSVDFSN